MRVLAALRRFPLPRQSRRCSTCGAEGHYAPGHREFRDEPNDAFWAACWRDSRPRRRRLVDTLTEGRVELPVDARVIAFAARLVA